LTAREERWPLAAAFVISRGAWELAGRTMSTGPPLLLARDREPGLRYDGSLIYPPERELWG